MHTAFIRVWRKIDLGEIARHLLIIGELTGTCHNCRQIGIDYNSVSTCPKCQTAFKYIASRRPEGLPIYILKKLFESKPGLVFIDYRDFKQANDRFKAKQFFKE